MRNIQTYIIQKDNISNDFYLSNKNNSKNMSSKKRVRFSSIDTNCNKLSINKVYCFFRFVYCIVKIYLL
jgi:hypothetical protein